ncbi:MAG: hypothetical protein U0L05_08150 [Schaedlerella sp.]|nr:hypothetical protein [Schaedlerella sp.]
MNDSLYELIVVRKPRTTDMLIRILMIFATIVVSYISLIFAGSLFILAAAGMIAITVFLVFPRLNVEYEYSLLNHYLEISEIYNKEKRRKKIDINIQEAEIIAPFDSPRLKHYHAEKTLNFTSGSSDVSIYSIIIPFNQTTTQILVEADAKMLQRMKGWMGQKMFLD